MIRFLLTIVVLFAGMTAEAQQSTVKRIYPKQEQKSENRSERRKAERKQRQSEKFIQAEIDSINYANALQALENLDFVLEADQLVFKRGMSVFVSTTTNFISVQNDKAVVQIAPFNAGGGPNGVGGITVEGLASNIQIKTDKRGTSYFSMSVMGKGISATVSITLPKGTDQASVTVNPNFHSNRITLNGTLMPAEKSRVFQGITFSGLSLRIRHRRSTAVSPAPRKESARRQGRVLPYFFCSLMALSFSKSFPKASAISARSAA